MEYSCKISLCTPKPGLHRGVPFPLLGGVDGWTSLPSPPAPHRHEGYLLFFLHCPVGTELLTKSLKSSGEKFPERGKTKMTTGMRTGGAQGIALLTSPSSEGAAAQWRGGLGSSLLLWPLFLSSPVILPLPSHWRSGSSSVCVCVCFWGASLAWQHGSYLLP